MPLAPVLPNGPARKYAHMRLRRIVVIHGAGPGATIRSRVDAIVYVYGHPPFSAAGVLPEQWPAAPVGLLVEEIVGRVFTDSLSIEPQTVAHPQPRWGQFELETNFLRRNIALDMIANVDPAVLRSTALGIRHLDRGTRPHLLAPTCVSIHPYSGRFQVTLSNVIPGRSYRFKMWHHSHFRARHSHSKHRRAYRRSLWLGRHRAGWRGSLHFSSGALRWRGELGAWTLKVLTGSHRFVAESKLRVQWRRCPSGRRA